MMVYGLNDINVKLVYVKVLDDYLKVVDYLVYLIFYQG